MVRFLPEKVSTLGGIKSQNIPVLANTEIQWERTEPKKSKGSSASGSGSGTGSTTPTTGGGDEG